MGPVGPPGLPGPSPLRDPEFVPERGPPGPEVSTHCARVLSVFMPPTSEKLKGHIALGLSVRPSEQILR